MSDISIRLKVSDDGSLALLDDAGKRIAGIGDYAASSADLLQSLGTSLARAADSSTGSQSDHGLDSMLGTQRLLNQAYTDGNGILQAANGFIQAALGPLREQVALAKERSKIQSVDQAFGVKRDGLYSQIDTLGADATAQRKVRAASDRKQGMSKSATDADLVTFDKEAAKAMDDYAIATGQATAESLKFRDIRNQISRDGATGKITLQQEAAALLELGKAAKEGNTSLEDLDRIQTKIALQKGHTAATAELKQSLTDSVTSKTGADDKDPFGPMKLSADRATDATSKLGSTSIATSAQLVSAGLAGAVGLTPIIGTANRAANAVSAIQRALTSLITHVSIDVSMSGGGGSGRMSM